MQRNRQQRASGFTLIEMLLVMVIISSVIYMGIGYVQQRTLNLRIDRTAAQMQQILNAGMAYYVNNGTWPTTLACLQGSGTGCTQVYLPSTVISPWGTSYSVSASRSNFYVYVDLSGTRQNAYGAIIAGKLPLAFSTITPTVAGAGTNAGTVTTGGACTTGDCAVVTSVNIPGQNLNNASAINFANLYHNGACVPEPTCPVDATGTTMAPAIMVVPAAVSGTNEDGVAATGSPCTVSDTSGCSVNTYPLTSFSASATPATAVTGAAGVGPNSCGTGTPEQCFTTSDTSTGAGATPITSGRYYRACLSVVTERGTVAPLTNVRGQLMGTVLVVTKCVINNESTGSDFTVWSQ